MTVALRPFQQKIESDTYAAWDAGAKNVMVCAATGSGKTVVLSRFLLDEAGASIAIAHRQELVSQISVALARNGVRHRLVGAKKGSSLIRIVSALQIAEMGYSFFDPNARTGVGGVDTIIRMDENDPWFKQVRLMVQDEAHHCLRENKWGAAARMFPNARGLLPTATPLRADGKGLGRKADGIVDYMVLAPSMREIIDMGYLTDYRIYAPPSDVNIAKVKISQATGDFNAHDLRKAVHESRTMTGDIVGHYLKLAKGKLGVTFAVDVEAATEIAAAFRAAGVPAETVSAKTPDSLRAEIIARFKRRELLQLVNVDLFGEGFDLPAIEVVSFARHTQSFSLYCQQFGRALRLMLSAALLKGYNDLSDEGRRARIAASEKPVAIIIDHVGNVIRHGLPDARREWSLDSRERRGSSKSDAMPLRVCLATDCMQVYERTHKNCPWCGHYPEPALRSAPEHVDGDLTELDPDVLRAMRGEIARIDGAAAIPWGASPAVEGSVKKQHWLRQQSQHSLREVIAWWAGYENTQGRTESESYRRFYHRFGVDIASCMTYGAREANELNLKITLELAKLGVMVQ